MVTPIQFQIFSSVSVTRPETSAGRSFTLYLPTLFTSSFLGFSFLEVLQISEASREQPFWTIAPCLHDHEYSVVCVYPPNHRIKTTQYTSPILLQYDSLIFYWWLSALHTPVSSRTFSSCACRSEDNQANHTPPEVNILVAKENDQNFHHPALSTIIQVLGWLCLFAREIDAR